MITKIGLKNYKSIYDAEVNLMPLTVIVGANGSGKSNFIKAVEFLSSITNIGLANSINKSGGVNTFFPNTIKNKDLRGAILEFHYEGIIPSPRRYPDSWPKARASHDLKLEYLDNKSFRVKEEIIKFFDPIAVSKAISGEGKIIEKEYPGESSIEIIRRFQEKQKLFADPSISDNLLGYQKWLGLEFLSENIDSESKLRSVLESMVARKKSDNPQKCSLLETEFSSFFDFSPEFKFFLPFFGSTKRYDLLLNELRIEQKQTYTKRLNSSGNNMPTVLKQLKNSRERKARDSWDRILGTMQTIAPHVDSIRTNSLPNGKEFIEFVETSAKRGVESWETSDGTLRTLALLLSLETHPEYSTLLIEEPEQNLHPWAIRAILNHMREVVEKRNLQVIITTHSQQVLEKLEPDELLVALRNEKRGTIFSRIQDVIPSGKIVMGEIGNLWVKGLLGGVPNYD
jgi:predicted ATPase